jgi:hypothetical protein
MALAALMTGGTFSDRKGGSAVGTIKPSPLDGLTTDEPVTVALRDGVDDVVTVLLRLETVWLLSEIGNSCRRTGSEPCWYLEVTAGVFKKAPGTGRTGVVCGNDITGSKIVALGGPG